MTFDELERAVKKLKPVLGETGDRFYRVYCCDTMLGKTKRSRNQGRRKDVGPNIAAAIPRQLNITKGLWADISGCRSSRPEYLEARGHAGHE